MRAWIALLVVASILSGCVGDGRNLLAFCEGQPFADVDGPDHDGTYYQCDQVVGATAHVMTLQCEHGFVVGAEAEREPLPNGTIEVRLAVKGTDVWNATIDPIEGHAEETGDEAWHFFEGGGTARFYVSTSVGFDGDFAFGGACVH